MTERSMASPWLLSNVGLDDESARKLLLEEVNKPNWWVNEAVAIRMSRELFAYISRNSEENCSCEYHRAQRYLVHQKKIPYKLFAMVPDMNSEEVLRIEFLGHGDKVLQAMDCDFGLGVIFELIDAAKKNTINDKLKETEQ